MFNDVHIKADHISLTINGHRVLKDVSFSAPRNQFIGILGPNGSGKTSLLRCLYGSMRPDSGDIQIDNQWVSSLTCAEQAKKVAVVLQHQSVNIPLLVQDILRLGRMPHQTLLNQIKLSWSDNEFGIIRDLDLKPLLNRYYEELSGGEKQRVLIARALIQKPTVLLLDEPTNHLDIFHQLSLLRYIKKLKITVICSLHDLNLAAEFCDQVAVMHRGCLIQQGVPEDVLTSALINEVFQVQSVQDIHPETGALRLSVY